MTTEVENPWGQINHKLADLKIKHAEKELIEDANRRWAENSLPLTTPGGLTQPEWEAWLSNPSRLGDKETVSRLADIWFELLEGRTRTRQRVYGEECQRQGCAETGGFSKKVLDCNLVSLFSSSDKEFEDRLEDYVKTRNVDKDLLEMGAGLYRQKASDFHTQVEEEIEIQVQEKAPAANQGGDVIWDTIEISFLSDERVQIRNGTDDKTYNYNEVGFEDSRDGKPNQAWATLRDLALEKGVLLIDAKRPSPWPKVEKRIQEIRKALRNHFRTSSDPILFKDGFGYQARFKISVSPSFHT